MKIRLRNMWDKLSRRIAFRLPKLIVYHATIRVFARATTGRYSDRTPDSVTVFEALDVWMGKKGS